MKKLLFTNFLLFLFFWASSSFSPAFAAQSYPCGGPDKTITVSQNPVYLSGSPFEPTTVTFIVEGNLSKGTAYYLEFSDSLDKTPSQEYNGKDPLTFQEDFYLPNNVEVNLRIVRPGPPSNQLICTMSKPLVVDLTRATLPECNLTISPNPADLNDPINISLKDLTPSTSYAVSIGLGISERLGTTDINGDLQVTLPPANKIGTHKISVLTLEGLSACSTDEQIQIVENIDEESTSFPGQTSAAETRLCCLNKPEIKPENVEKSCPEPDQGVSTALGCIPIRVGPFVNNILTRAISIGGGIAFLLMLYGAFILITSAGNPENTKKGKEIITSAVVGLLFIIFSVFLLKLIGVDILQLDQFGFGGQP